ncbi:hypothetical protein FHX42_003267 [Saccharopolyspora lacisalsi]|uniref:Uncharacterized protein n=1 Tax=Halosaccharopolyspora lacisalsi TaxID=1000566 RepID=A0A839E3D5_9PSEU|nr:hypothetical protein [Halosaccharopolyspora lacisalsi]MBA8825901.1 hypothetical protein [Halosaccharopolyspora lacisalsi]
MSTDTDSLVRFGRNEHGHISVHVPETHRPVLDLLRDLPTRLRPEILEHARHPTGEEWDTGGNGYGIIIDSSGVTVEDEVFDITLATLPTETSSPSSRATSPNSTVGAPKTAPPITEALLAQDGSRTPAT